MKTIEKDLEHVEMIDITGENLLKFFVNDIQAEMRDQGENALDLAKRMGINPSVVYYALRSPSAPVLNRLAAMYREYGYTKMKLAIYLD